MLTPALFNPQKQKLIEKENKQKKEESETRSYWVGQIQEPIDFEAKIFVTTYFRDIFVTT